MFKKSELIGFTGDSLIDVVNEKLAAYHQVNYLGTLFSGCIFLSIINKIIFNLAARVKLVFDLWTAVDLISSMMNLFCFNYIGSV